MTKSSLNPWVISRVVIAILILVAVILFPVAVFAESENETTNIGTSSPSSDNNSVSAPGEVIGSDVNVPGQNIDFGSSDSADVTSPQDPQDFNETTLNETPFENSPENDDQNSGSDNPDAPDIDSPEEGETDPSCSGNSYVATITPDAVAVPGSGGNNQIPAAYIADGGLTGGDVGSFIITFTEVGDKTIGSAQVTIPGTFTDLTFDPSSIAVPSGKNWSGGLVGQVLSLWALDSASYLDCGESVSATVTATTPTAVGQHEFVTSAWTDANAGFDGVGSTVNNRATGYSDPVVIVGLSVSTADELNAIRGGLGLYGDYVQTGDINLSGYTNWEPIGTNFNSFNGSYNGNGFKISNLTINRPDADYIGLFGRAGSASYDAVLSNIHLENVNVTGRNNVGGLVGYGRGTISNSCASVSVNGNDNVGGLVGSSDACTVTNSYVSGFVNGNDNVGGLVGVNYEGMVTDSYASGSVTGNDNVGGLVGYNYRGGVTDSYATGDVGGRYYVGGLIGRNNQGTITDSYATGSVNGISNHVGGLVGGSNGGTITNCYATGSVTGNDNVGGLVGLNDQGTVTNGYATGAVIGNDNVGGLVGNHYIGTVTNCYATGAVTGYSDIGGLVGLFNGTVTNCYAAGAVTGTVNVGGLVGYHYGGTVTDSFWDTTTSGQSASAGGTGKTTSQMKQLATYGAWDISAQGGESTVWRIYETSTYPLLRHFFADRATITVSAASRDYDGTTVLTGGIYQLEDGKNDDWVHNGTVSYQASSKNAGSVEVALLGVYSNQKEYDLVFLTDGSVTISPRSLTLSNFTADNKVYDGTTAVTGDGFSDDRIGEDLLNFTYTVDFTDKHVGTGKTVNYSGIAISSGADQGNYTLANNAGTATAVISALPITVTAATDVRVYDGTFSSSGVPLITSGALVGEDAVLWTQTFDTKDVGTGKTLTPAGAVNDGNSGNNYAVTFVPALTGEITVKPITIAPDSGQSKVSGDADPVFTYQHTALIGDDQIAGTLGRVAGEELGNYAYTLGNLSVSSNYNLLMTANPASFAVVEQPVEPDPDPDPDPTPDPDPVPGPDPGSGFGSGFDFTGFPAPAFPAALVQTSLTVAPAAPLVSPGRFLVLAPEGPQTEAAPLVTPEFVRSASPEELAAVLAFYEELLQNFEENWETMSESEYALALLDLAAAWAAIQAVEASLNGEAADLDLALEAYLEASELLAEYGALLNEAQLAVVEAILEAVADVLTALGVDFSQPGL